MAKKSTTNTERSNVAVLDAPINGNAVYLKLKSVVVNEAIAAREGAPDSEKVERYATNFIERREDGRPHQLQPAIVRSSDGTHFELIDGRHRFEACIAATEASGQEFELWSVVVPANDEQSLVDAIQANEYREDPNDFDRAQAIEKLIALGKTQADCARIFGMSEGTISQVRKVGKLDKKYRKAIENGDIERDGALLIASMEGDDTAKNEIFEEALRHKKRFEDISASLENKRTRKEADGRISEAREKAEKVKELAKAKEIERKLIEKEVKDIEATASKTKEVDELIKIREAQAVKKAEAETLAAQERDLVKEKEKAEKELTKAKEAKDKLKDKLAGKAKVTAEDVKEAGKNKGVKVGQTDSPRSKKAFEIEMEAMGTDGDDPMPEACNVLMGKLQAYLDGNDSAKQLRNAFVAACKTDEQWESYRTSKKGKK